jgi:predicted dienelactone hydrolase
MAAPRLPGPTGPYPVGGTALWLTDASRPDPWAAGVKVRELMVSLWYPAAPSAEPRTPYMTPAESRLQLTSRGITGVPVDVLSTVRTHAVSGAAPAGRPHGHPLVVLSPGFTNHRSTLTGLAEDLASHGYVVAGVDHTYESYATAFPDGRIATGLARQHRRPGGSFWEQVVAGRAADVCFVLGELTTAAAAASVAALIDPERIGVAGHSIGGATAIAALLADHRIRAGIDMDGSTIAAIPAQGLSRPFLFLGKQSNYTPGGDGAVRTWERDWRRLTGWKRWLVVAGAVHASFTDLALIADQAGLDIEAGLTGARSLDITRAYVRAFFDQQLRGEPQVLLAEPSPRYPEVTFCRSSLSGSGDLVDGPPDQVGQGTGATAGCPVPGRGADRGHDRGREHLRVQIPVRVGAGPLSDRLGQWPLGLGHRVQRLALQRGRGHHHADQPDPLRVHPGGGLVLGGEDPGQGVGQRLAGRPLAQGIDGPREALGVQRRDRLFLVREVVGEGPAGHVHRVGDVLHPDVLQAALDRERHRGEGQGLLGRQLLALAQARALGQAGTAVHEITIDSFCSVRNIIRRTMLRIENL